MNGTGKRYFLVDAVRGAAIVNMVIFHFLYYLKKLVTMILYR